MKDYIIRATAADSQIRAFAATTRELVEKARVAHGTSPVVTAALGRLLTAGAMMGSMLKGEDDLLTLRIEGDGPMRGLLVTADSEGFVKGYPFESDVMLPPSPAGKLDVGGAVGQGTLSIIRDMGLKEPYVGQINLVSGEIAEDLTYYYAVSEQVPSSVALGVLMNRDNTVRRAGGFIIQLLPNTSEEVIAALEEKLSQVKSITSMLDQDMTPEEILESLLGDMGLEITEKRETDFVCNCTRERVSKALISIGKQELQQMIAEDKPIEVNCHFCNKNYGFDVEDLKEFVKQA
ncbi:MAG: Hsp33 family molecular chaperone HslO [Lachnospiraceae bacterium]|nr:Hsp33 family molecular chaperone HslO [Lachnospiraceae bacterium]